VVGMVLRPKNSCQWGTVCCCCGVRTSTILICSLYLILQAAFLALTILVRSKTEESLQNFLEIVDTEDSRLENSYFYTTVRTSIVQNNGDYFVLPITVSVVLIVSNILTLWGAIFNLHLLLLPWIILYLVLIIFSSSILIYIIILLHDIWFQAILFLVIVPEIVLGAAFWFVVVSLYRSTRHSHEKQAAPPPHPLPPTVYTPEPHSWDQPLPVWAVNPPESAWDPSYLQQLDPRYAPGRARSYTSGQQSEEESYRESDQSSRESGHYQTDSVSLSTKYRQDRQEYSDLSDSQADTQSDSDTQYHAQSDSDTHHPLSDVREETAESDEEHSAHFNHHAEVEEEDEDYDIGRIPRPKSRFSTPDLYKMSGTTIQSSSA